MDQKQLTPGDYIKEELQKRNWTQADLAAVVGRHLPAINEIIQGKRGITADMAVALGAAFNNSPEIWMQREGLFRLSQVEPASPEVEKKSRLLQIAPIKDMERRQWINKTETTEELEKEVCSFFEIQSLNENPKISVSPRKSTPETDLNSIQRAWCFRAKHLAKTVTVSKFTTENFNRGFDELKNLTAFPDQITQVPKILAQMGVRLLIIEPLPQSKIDGAAFWKDEDSPVIALSIRYDRIDCFWYTLFHELSHIRHQDSLSVDNEIYGEYKNASLDGKEIRADEEASASLVEKEKLDSFIVRVKPLYSKQRIIQFANKNKVHPGIVVGQLQHKKEIKFSTNREMLVKIRDLITSVSITDGWGKVAPSI